MSLKYVKINFPLHCVEASIDWPRVGANLFARKNFNIEDENFW